MRGRAARFGTAVLLAALAAPGARAQQASYEPRIGCIYPAGGRAGTTVRVTAIGQFLDGVSAVHVTGGGVSGTVVEHIKPPTGAQLATLRDRVKALVEKKRAAAAGKPAGGEGSAAAVWTPAEEKELADAMRVLGTPWPMNRLLSEKVVFDVAIAPEAGAGDRRIRLATPRGLTGPFVFEVGVLPEFVEPETAGPIIPYPNSPAPKGDVRSETDVSLPVVANGRIMPGGADRYRFSARRGERLVFAVRARSLIPYIADAVPGWFQATLAILDANGKELAYADDYRFSPDPVVFFDAPRDGEYLAEIRDSIYRGREDFVYRIAMGALPFVESVFPLGGAAGAPVAVEVRGRNLPSARLALPAEDAGVRTFRVSGSGGLVSNEVAFARDELPESAEKEPNDRPSAAQRAVLPVIVNGRIDRPGDEDVFRFEGRAGAVVTAEIAARRLGSPLDSMLTLTDGTGLRLAFNDDWENKAEGLETHHADSRLSAVLPADGVYLVRVGDTQGRGGAEYAYRLRLGPPRPDFELRVEPSAVIARGGRGAPVTVHAIRKDGFAGEILLSLSKGADSFSIGGGRIPPGCDRIRITLSALGETGTFTPVLEGRATADGRECVRRAVPVEDMMQAFGYRHLVPAGEWLAVVGERFTGREPVRVTSPVPLRLAPGGTGRVRVSVPGWVANSIQCVLVDPPAGVSVGGVFPGPLATEIEFRADPAAAKPGVEGNLLVNVFVQPPKPAAGAEASPPRRPWPWGMLPAIPFVIAAP